MVLGLAADGNQLTDGAENILFTQSALNHYGSYIYTQEMQTGDKLTIRVYVLDSDTPALRKYLDIELSGVQLSPAVFIPFIPTGQYRISIQRTSGVDRTYPWQVFTA